MLSQILLNIIAGILLSLYLLGWSYLVISIASLITYIIKYIIKNASIRKSIRLLEKNGFQKEATDILDNGVCEYVFRLYDDSGNTKCLVVQSELPYTSAKRIKYIKDSLKISDGV